MTNTSCRGQISLLRDCMADFTRIGNKILESEIQSKRPTETGKREAFKRAEANILEKEMCLKGFQQEVDKLMQDKDKLIGDIRQIVEKSYPNYFYECIRNPRKNQHSALDRATWEAIAQLTVGFSNVEDVTKRTNYEFRNCAVKDEDHDHI